MIEKDELLVALKVCAENNIKAYSALVFAECAWSIEPRNANLLKQVSICLDEFNNAAEKFQVVSKSLMEFTVPPLN